MERTGTFEEALRTCMKEAIIEVAEEERFATLLMFQLVVIKIIMKKFNVALGI